MYERNKKPSFPYPDNILKAIGIEDITDTIRDNMISVMNSSLLSERERHCLNEYYRYNRIYSDISNDYDVTRERIRQVVELGLSKLRKNKNLITRIGL